MAKLVRPMDWAATAPGPIGQRPQSRRTVVSLASNFPINIALKPGNVQIYNDGYWPICGGKHPDLALTPPPGFTVSGLGLAIVEKMIELHGGRIWIDIAPPARGTSFIFTWPENPQ
jgi:hypothetical protein